MVQSYLAKNGECAAIEAFHNEAAKKGITIKKFRIDHVGQRITVRATEYVK